jgi:hypothetical protein
VPPGFLGGGDSIWETERAALGREAWLGSSMIYSSASDTCTPGGAGLGGDPECILGSQSLSLHLPRAWGGGWRPTTGSRPLALATYMTLAQTSPAAGGTRNVQVAPNPSARATLQKVSF